LSELDYNTILKGIKPSKQEHERVMKLADDLVNAINETASELNIEAEAVLVGSVSKGTWLSGNADIDILIKFPLESSTELLKKYGLKIGHKTIEKMGGSAEERYASHPYVTGYIEDYYVDFVPCYNIKSYKELKSAVDRTLLHTKYIKANLTPKQEDEVVLLKKFMESVGTYGSEFKVGGFSGYLCELMILKYGNFIDTIDNAANEWNYGHTIDLMNYKTGGNFKDPLVAVDPVDPNRNVAAALTLQKMSEFVVAALNFQKEAKESYFKQEAKEIYPANLIQNFSNRKTRTVLIMFKPPNIPADAVFPQIKKTEHSIVKMVESEGFKVFGSASWTDEIHEAVILIEFEVWELPLLKKHLGPKIWIREHQQRFLDKYPDNAWIEGDRWVVGVEREHTKVTSLLSDLMTGKKSGYLKFGKHLKKKIMAEHQIMDVNNVIQSQTKAMGLLSFLNQYLHPGDKIFR
jgi:tRNA nucleotidyltransferase (CCA-adding enzyme)